MRTSSSNNFLDQIYEAALIPEMWSSACTKLAREVNATTATIFAIDHIGTHRFVCSPNAREEIEFFSKHPSRLDNIRFQRALELMPSTFGRDLDIMTAEELQNDRVLLEVINRFGNQWVVGAVLQEPSGHFIMFDIQRKIGMDHFSDAEVAHLNRLKPDLARSIFLSSRLAFSEAKTIANTMSVLGLPAAVLDDGCRVLAANSEFEGLSPRIQIVSRDKLLINRSSAQNLLTTAIMQLSAMITPTVQSIPLPSENENKPLVLHLLPVRRAARDIFGRALTIVVVTAVGEVGPPEARVLCGLFDLTPREAKVARVFAKGKPLEEIAKELDIGRETIRAHLKSVMLKTGTHRQAELMALLLGLATPPSSKTQWGE